MIRKILFCLAMAGCLPCMKAADGDWKLHLSVDESYQQLFDTPEHLYIVAYGQPYVAADAMYKNAKLQLFVHDKSSGETLGYSSRNYLSGKVISMAQYNAAGGYLCIVYADGNMDLLYDDGHTVNIPALKNASLTESKKVNSITFGLDDGKIYAATDFGFVVINAAEKSIEKARNYHHVFSGIARVGGKLILSDNEKFYVQNYNAPLQSLDEFNAVELGQTSSLMLPLQENKVLMSTSKAVSIFRIGDENNITLEREIIADNRPTHYGTNKQGYLMYGSWALVAVSFDGQTIAQGGYPDNSYQNAPIASTDTKTFYLPDGRKGIRKFTTDTGIGWDAVWKDMGNLSRPNASAVFWSAYMSYNPKYGILTSNPSHNRLFNSQYEYPTLVSGLKNGEWTMYGNAYVNPLFSNVHRLAKGVTVDPNNPDIIYLGSRNDGMQIMNLSNPEDVVTLAAKGSPASSLPGFIQIKEAGKEGKSFFNLDEPRFDGAGNLWSYHYNAYDINGEGDLYVWPAASLRNKDYRKFHNITTGIESGIYGQVWPLKAAVNRNLVLLDGNFYSGGLALFDHNGTLDNPSDDRVLLLNNLTNQDGGSITYGALWCMYEDEATGTVWIGTDNGIFTIQPSKMFDNPTQARRIKVARNDGTNLADYLLDGNDVRYITSDGNGNKWFATLGAGVVQTSAEGTHVMRQLTADNSYLPSDNTYRLCYNPANNSMMIGTMEGMAEYFLPGSSTGVGFDNVKIYPNPVRPDFTGYITIEGLLSNSLVKIVDAEGNLVKELGSSMNGSVKWDGTNITGAKVNSGVYFVFMSRSGENASEANVGKVLVVK